MKNYLDIAGHTFSLMFIEPKLGEANYLNLPMKQQNFKKKMSHIKDKGRGLRFIPVLDNLTF